MESLEHLYFHIPFCPQLCDYCSFYSEKGDASKTRRFLESLILEVRQAANQYTLQPRTIFFGGGTPSALSVSQFELLFAALEKYIPGWRQREELTVEMNPATVSLDKARLLLSLGVNRISMGAQAFDDQTLHKLNRVHDADRIVSSYEILREAGFQNINLDLMFAVPGQTVPEWKATLSRALELRPDHLSCYCLTYEEDTPFFERMKAGQYTPEDDTEADMFRWTHDTMESQGFVHYEISNYARPGFECRHNLSYWRGRDCLSFGPSACGTLGTLRYKNIPDTDEYCRRVEQGESLHSFTETIDPTLRRRERLMFGLRTSEGISREESSPWRQELEPYFDKQWLVESSDRIRLTPAGLLFADEIATVFA